MPEVPAHFKRHWLLTTVLLVAVFGNILAAAANPVYFLVRHPLGAVPRFTPWLVLGLSAVAALQALFATALPPWPDQASYSQDGQRHGFRHFGCDTAAYRRSRCLTNRM